MLTLHVGPGRLARSRFALSRLAELSCALEVLTHPARAPFARAWVDRTRSRLDPRRMELLSALLGGAPGTPDGGPTYVPDFLVPWPETYDSPVAAELARVARTPADTVRTELRAAFGAVLPHAVTAVLDSGGERAVAETSAAQLRYSWDVVLADDWPALERVLDEDVRARAAVAAREGFGGILGGLHPSLCWDGQRLTRDTPAEAVLAPEPGVVLAPSVFLPWPAWWHGSPGRVLLGYPARGRGRVWAPPGPVLGPPVLGARRIALLADLATPRSTSELAARHGLSPATVSYHLRRLRTDDLVTARRDGHSVVYAPNDRARALLAAMEWDGQ
ncbi:helix-turn-helix transcriptional regulator [Saccharomonospora piscinae]|uniref:helix-turn-helix domain-containing protein n=1 Tax=Saccharomonospora piscinae TaxID=687388 RepID=UPI0011057E76|nr:helix-turn-helix domain-containing protein [Saccharomonospora piscinae]TLW90354.1 helix-turn-helix transcriptional regulator [Saccharomonospora piscinae]